MLSKRQLMDMPDNTIFAHGLVADGADGVNITNSGRVLRWLAKRGNGFYDWTIYIGLSSDPESYIVTNGDKVTGEAHIKKLVPCDDEAYKLYRR